MIKTENEIKNEFIALQTEHFTRAKNYLLFMSCSRVSFFQAHKILRPVKLSLPKST